MNKEEILNKYIDLIDKGYCSDCNELNCIDNFPHAKITHAIRELQQENQSLKKQLEETDRKLFLTKNELDMREKSIDNKLNQQKEFIKYLENMLDDENDIFSVVRVKDVLQNYREIIGDMNDKK